MRVKVIKLGLFVIMTVGLVWLIIWHFGRDRAGGEVESTSHLRAILGDLVDRRELRAFEGGSILRAEDVKEWTERREAASEKLRALGTNVLPELMHEARAFRAQKRMDTQENGLRLLQLQRAFNVLGTNAAPLLRELVDEFRVYGNTAALPGIGYIEEIEGGLAIVCGLTNANWEVRLASTLWLQECFSTNQVVVAAALPYVIENPRHTQQCLRAASASALGVFRSSPEIVIPLLLRGAEEDEDFVARAAALKAIAKFGTNATTITERLEALAANDPHPSVRQVASEALTVIVCQYAQ